MQILLQRCKILILILPIRFNASLAGGELFGPIAGGYLAKWYGMARAGSILGGLVLFLSACYVPYLYMDDKIKRKKSNKVKSE